MTRTWIARIAQEYEFEAETADDALAFCKNAADRPIPGATLKAGEAHVAEKRHVAGADD